MKKTFQWPGSSGGEAGIQKVVQQRRTKLETSKQEIAFSGQKSELFIKDVKGWILREPVSKRGYTVIKIQTASGLTGFGECAQLSPAEFAEAKRLITGVPVTSFEIIAPVLAHIPTARAALNIAMLDAAAQVAKAPVFQYLGGPTRHKARAIAHLAGDTDQALISSMERLKAAGYRAFMVPVPVFVHRNQGQSQVLETRKRLDSLREAGGAGTDFVLDGNFRLTPGDAQMISAAIENFHVLWFNEPCPAVSLGALRKISAESVTPVGLGSMATDTGEILNYLRDNAIDIIRPSIGLNGVSQIRRMAVIAETYYVAAGPSHNGGPIGTAAALHLAASIPNFFIQEIPYPEAEQDRQMRSDLTSSPVEAVKEGFAELLTGPGLGITVNEKNLEKYKEVSL